MIEEWIPEDPWPGGTRELMIVGPPGTGKTSKVLERYVWPALGDGGIVLATSFTKAAARELRERTGEKFDRDPLTWRESLTTIHSEATRRCAHLGLKFTKAEREGKAAPEGAEDCDWAEALQRIEDKSNDDYQRAWDFVRQVWPQDIGRTPRQRLAHLLHGRALDEAEALVNQDLHGRYDESGRLVNPDFTGLLELAATEGAGRSLDLIAIDEAQDLSPLQWLLIDRWISQAGRVLIVGDPDQAIYGWAGADGRRLLSWIRAGRCTRRLAQSWRVPRLAHAAARRVIRLVMDREDSPYLPADRDGEVLTRDSAEAFGLAAEAQEAGRSVLVLSRTVKGCGLAVEELLADGIPHVAERGRRILDKGGRWLKVASAAFAWAYGGRADGESARAFVAALSAKGSVLRPGGVRVVKSHLQAALKDMERDEVPWSWCASSGLGLGCLQEQVEQPSMEWWAQAFLPSQVDANALLTIIGWLQMYGSRKELLDVASRIAVTTAHGSKGRQADLVVLDARSAVSFQRRAGASTVEVQSIDERIAEDLRVLYVAITRTKNVLVVIRGEGRDKDWLDTHNVRVRA